MDPRKTAALLLLAALAAPGPAAAGWARPSPIERRSVRQADEFYSSTLRRLSAGAGSIYLRQLLFPPLPPAP